MNATSVVNGTDVGEGRIERRWPLWPWRRRLWLWRRRLRHGWHGWHGRQGRALAALADEAGAATAEYAIATLAAVGLAGLLVVVLRGDDVKGLLTELIHRALTSAG